MSQERPPRAPTHQDRLAALHLFETEYATHSHRRMAASWNEPLFRGFPPAERYRPAVETAIRCAQALNTLVVEYRHGHWDTVVGIYGSWREHFDQCQDYLTAFAVYVQAARERIAIQYKPQLLRALHQNDDADLEGIIFKAAAVIKPTPLSEYFGRVLQLTPAEQARVSLARERLATIREVQRRLNYKDAQEQALALYDQKADTLRLTESNALTANDRVALYEARRAQTRQALREAIAANDDDQILAAANAALAAGWSLPDATLDIIRQAGERRAARERVEQAENLRDLFVAYDPELLDQDRKLARDKRDTIRMTQAVYKPLLALKRAIKKYDLRTIAALTGDQSQLYDLISQLDDSEKGIVMRVQTVVQTLQGLRRALAVHPHTEATLKQISDLYNPPETARMLDLLLTPLEKEQVRKALAAYALVGELKQLDRAPVIPANKLAIAQTVQRAQAQGLGLPNTLNWNKIRAALEFEARWKALKQAIENNDERAIWKAWNPNVMYESLHMLTEADQQRLRQVLQSARRGARYESMAQPPIA